MGMIDLVVIATVIISILFALYRGLLRELLGITSWILAGLAALYSYQPLITFAQSKVENVHMFAMIGSAILALIVLILMTLFNARITKRLRKSALSGLDRTLGLAFGVARAALVIVLVWLFARQMALTPHQIESMTQHNLSIPYINIGADWIATLLPENIQQDMEKPIELPVPDYQSKDRQSLDNMIDSMVQIEEIES